MNFFSKQIQRVQFLLREHWIGLLSGLLAATSYIPFPPWAMLFYLTPLIYVVVRTDFSLKRVFWNAWWMQFVSTLIGFSWIYHTAYEFGNLPRILSLGAVILFAALMYLHIPASCVLTAWLRKKVGIGTTQTAFVFALLYGLLERIWPTIFNWNFAYMLLWTKNPAAQWADVIGFEGLAALLLLTQASLFVFGLRLWEKKSFAAGAEFILIPAFIWIALMATGHRHQMQWSQSQGQLSVGVVQANIGNIEKIQGELGTGYEFKIIQQHLDLMKQAKASKEKIDLYIWPETAFPDLLDERYLRFDKQQFLLQQLRDFPSSVLLGGYSREVIPAETPEGKSRVKNYNASFLFDNKQNLLSFYRKTQLLIFGEYIPLSETFPVLLDWFPFIAGFGRGPGPTVLQTSPQDSPQEKIGLGMQICYEGLSPAFSRSLSEKNAQILVNLTNDSWFGKDFEPFQHMIITLARAIEVRRPLIRATNTGVSTVIQADGTMEAWSPQDAPWTHVYEVRYQKNPEQTIFVQYGHYNWIFVCLALCSILAKARFRGKVSI